MTNIDRISDAESVNTLLHLLADETIRRNRVENVRTILVILSGRSVAFDDASLRQKIGLTYPDARIYFMSTEAHAVGTPLPDGAKIDLLIDFTGPGHRHKWLWARKLRSATRVCVGRPAGLFRQHIYDRLFDESKHPGLPKDVIQREREVQRHVLAMAGVPVAQKGNVNPDLGNTIAAELPPLRNLR
jgi:hypothetical protein